MKQDRARGDGTGPAPVEIAIPLEDVTLPAHLWFPAGSRALTVFIHGSGSSRHSPRNNYVAGQLNRDGLATLLFDLLTEQEDRDRERRFDIDLLTRRTDAVLAWIRRGGLSANGGADLESIALFGASTGAAAAIRSAVSSQAQRATPPVCAVVSRGGRPDLAGTEPLRALRTPTLLIVGAADSTVLSLNEEVRGLMHGEVNIEVVPKATHLFEEPGALEQVAAAASAWIRGHCAGAGNPA